MTDPPSEAGADQLTVACALPALAVTPVGAPGTVAGVTELDATEAVLVPTALVAVTVNVYDVPFVSPTTVAVSAPLVHVPVAPPGLAVAV